MALEVLKELTRCSNHDVDLFRVGQIFTKTFAKKHGSGKGNWGRPGDEMYNLPMSVKDPSFDPTEDAMDQALYDHMKSGVEWSPDGSPRLSYSSSELEIDGFDFFDEDSS
mmetsp:Transcript_15963/g.53447  ORF Transcript_15963/g.53447 Transcript_15963/m.53447 type:complete len:110 (-) Transcript_15963:1634-1963(-)